MDTTPMGTKPMDTMQSVPQPEIPLPEIAVYTLAVSWREYPAGTGEAEAAEVPAMIDMMPAAVVRGGEHLRYLRADWHTPNTPRVWFLATWASAADVPLPPPVIGKPHMKWGGKGEEIQMRIDWIPAKVPRLVTMLDILPLDTKLRLRLGGKEHRSERMCTVAEASDVMRDMTKARVDYDTADEAKHGGQYRGAATEYYDFDVLEVILPGRGVLTAPRQGAYVPLPPAGMSWEDQGIEITLGSEEDGGLPIDPAAFAFGVPYEDITSRGSWGMPAVFVMRRMMRLFEKCAQAAAYNAMHTIRLDDRIWPEAHLRSDLQAELAGWNADRTK